MEIQGTICDPSNVCNQISLTLDLSNVAGTSGDGYQLFAVAFSSVIVCFLTALGVGSVIKIFKG